MASAITDTAAQPQVSRAEWRMRVDLAAFYRLAAFHGFDDFIYNHISARCPDEASHYLVAAFGMLFDEVTASTLLKIDPEGRVVSGPDRASECNVAVPGLHGVILRARPDLNCVAHVHTAEGMAVSAMACGLLPLTQTAMALLGRVAYVDYDAAADPKALARALGDRDVLILRHHGLVACGRTVAEAFLNIYNLVNACRAQVMALAAGAAAQPPAPHVVSNLVSSHRTAWLDRAAGIDVDGRSAEWRAGLRLLDRLDPSFRN